MKSFYDKDDYTTEDILSLITNEVEESIYLDFKECRALDKSDSVKRDISKDVASFANSDGGIIIYGIKEENHKASSLSFVDGNIYTKEWLEQIISSTVQRHITDLRIIPIRFNNSISNTIYIVKIPRSLDTPHISKSKKFYKRFNFESIAMEEYEVRQLYGRKIKSKLIIGYYSIIEIKSDKDDILKFEFEATVENNGEIPESSYKTNIYFHNLNNQISLKWDKFSKYDYTYLNQNRVKLSAVGHIPIYPNEAVTVIRFNIEVDERMVDAELDMMGLEITLFYPGGEEKIEFKSLQEVSDVLQTRRKTAIIQ